MPGIFEFTKVVHDAIAHYGKIFSIERQRRHFAEYFNCLMVVERKIVLGTNGEFATTTDQSCLNRFLTCAYWNVQVLKERRLQVAKDPFTLAYSLLMSQLRRGCASEWTFHRLMTIGEAYQAMLRESLGAALAWAIKYVVKRKRSMSHMITQLGLSGVCKLQCLRLSQRREAVNMRQAVLAVLLIGAAFLGGAFVTGPGLRWVQACVFQSLGANNGREIAAVNLELTSNAEMTTEHFEPHKLQSNLPANSVRPVRTIALEDKYRRTDEFLTSSTQAFREAPEQNGLNSKQADSSALLSATMHWLVTKSSSGGLLLAGAEFTSAITDPIANDFRSRPSNDKLSWSGQPGSISVLLPSSGLSNEVDQPSVMHYLPRPKSTEASSVSWPLLESKMRAMGVTRFIVEGELNGHIIFTCLIPLAGQRAISQGFEADAEDVSRAARAVLCHIALWRATQGACDTEVFTRGK